MITSKQMQAAARFDTGMAKPEAKPPLADAAGSAPETQWHQLVIDTLMDAAKQSWADGDRELHATYCQAIGRLLREWDI